MSSRLTKVEQETIVNFNETEQEASIYTFNQKWIRQLHKLSEQFPDKCKLERTGQHGEHVFIVPKSWMKVRAPRIMTEEQRRILSERAKAYLRPKSTVIIGDSGNEQDKAV